MVPTIRPRPTKRAEWHSGAQPTLEELKAELNNIPHECDVIQRLSELYRKLVKVDNNEDYNRRFEVNY